jgi:hypothetical protein
MLTWNAHVHQRDVPMPIKDTFLPEYDREMASTRRLLERIPLTEADWKPGVSPASRQGRRVL